MGARQRRVSGQGLDPSGLVGSSARTAAGRGFVRHGLSSRPQPFRWLKNLNTNGCCRKTIPMAGAILGDSFLHQLPHAFGSEIRPFTLEES
ncbi:unnamed protein product [Urochloa humidicola]